LILSRSLQNRVYRGEIVHKGAAYPGEHPAIVEEDLWREVQEKLEANGVERTGARDKAKLAFLLAGALFDAEGEGMTPTHAIKKGVRYRYYVSRRLITNLKASGADDPGRREQGQRLPAGDLEYLVIGRLKAFFFDRDAIAASLPRERRSAPHVKRALGAATEIARVLASEETSAIFDLLRPLLVRVQVHPDRIDIGVAAERIADALLGEAASSRDVKTLPSMGLTHI
jgi:site-specific DNA recombinase